MTAVRVDGREGLARVGQGPTDRFRAGAPNTGDVHQDHRVVAKTTWQTFSRHLVAEYEIQKHDGDFGRPNLFVAVDEAALQHKTDLLQVHYPSQHHRTWWGPDTFRAIARHRGREPACGGFPLPNARALRAPEGLRAWSAVARWRPPRRGAADRSGAAHDPGGLTLRRFGPPLNRPSGPR